MKNFVVGDIQGCYKGLRKLLNKAGFNPNKDKLWAVGDLIARGPDSLATLAYLYDLGPHFETVLGNHDLHLIACAYGISKPKSQDKLEPLMKHKHFSRYIDFLRQKPLAVSPAKKILISHAGLYPTWSVKKALKLSSEVQTSLQSDQIEDLLCNMYGNLPSKWDKNLKGHARNRFIINAFTRMRYVHKDLSLDFDSKCHPKNASANLTPWFESENTFVKNTHTLIFGHWASLLGEIPTYSKNPLQNHANNRANIIALDTGYVWGNKMTLYCLETKSTINISA